MKIHGIDIGGSPDIDSDLLRMDSSSDSGESVMPSMEPSSYDFSQQSTGRSDELRPGQSVKLVVPYFGEVRIGFWAMAWRYNSSFLGGVHSYATVDYRG